MEQVLIFGLGEEWYGLEIHKVQEVVAAPVHHYIPRAPAALLGAINFHGSILPVLDLTRWLGFPPAQKDARVIVLTAEQCRLALAVDRVRRIVPLDEGALIPYQAQEGEENFIRAVLGHQGEMINLLDVERLAASLEQLAGA